MKVLTKCAICNNEFFKNKNKISISGKHSCSKECFCQLIRQIKIASGPKPQKCENCSKIINKANKTKHCFKCMVSLKLNKWTDIRKSHLSQKRKEYLKNNPDKHPWRKSNKFKSIPCENFKKILREKNFSFLEEFSPSQDRLYSIDIAFPDKMIGIEVNGNQHYERDGKLKKYYQDRHNYIESLGWKLYQIHYSLCFDSNYILDLMSKILNTENKVEFNYEEYVTEKLKKIIREKLLMEIRKNDISKRKIAKLEKNIKKPKREKIIRYNLCKCGNIKLCKSLICRSCNNRLPKEECRKVARPSKWELHHLIWSVPNKQLSKKFGVSDNAIAKWCKYYGIKKPCRGFWNKFEVGKIIDYQI